MPCMGGNVDTDMLFFFFPYHNFRISQMDGNALAVSMYYNYCFAMRLADLLLIFDAHCV